MIKRRQNNKRITNKSIWGYLPCIHRYRLFSKIVIVFFSCFILGFCILYVLYHFHYEYEEAGYMIRISNYLVDVVCRHRGLSSSTEKYGLVNCKKISILAYQSTFFTAISNMLLQWRDIILRIIYSFLNQIRYILWICVLFTSFIIAILIFVYFKKIASFITGIGFTSSTSSLKKDFYYDNEIRINKRKINKDRYSEKQMKKEKLIDTYNFTSISN